MTERASPPDVDVDPRPTLFLTVGLPGVGKTTRAKELASTHRILRLTPDEWMAPHFGHSDAGGRRDILEGRMIWVAHEVLASGSSVVLDSSWRPSSSRAAKSSTTDRSHPPRLGTTPGRPGQLALADIASNHTG